MAPVQITSNNYGPMVAIIAWFLMVAMIVSVLVRLAIRRFITHRLGSEDMIVFGAMLFAVGQSVALSIAVQYGLGQHQSSLSLLQIQKVEKAEYTSDMLYIVAVSMAKVSVLQLLRQLVVKAIHKTIATITILVVVVWAVSALFTTAFRCGALHPWNITSGHCLNNYAFWAAMSPIDISTELMMIILPLLMIWSVQIRISRKMVVVGAFVFRLLVIAAIVLRVVYLHVAYHDVSDLSFSIRGSSIATSFLLNLSIVTACIPVLKPFLDSFDTGMLSISMNPRRLSNDSYRSYTMPTCNSGNETFLCNQNHSDKTTARGLGYSAAVEAVGQAKPVHSSSIHGRAGGDSMSSFQSDRMIIKRSDHFKVENEPAVPHLTLQLDGEHSELGPHRTAHPAV